MSQEGEDRWDDCYEDSDDESRSPMEEGHKEGDYYSINEHEAMNIRGGTTCGRRGQHSILKILMQIFAAAFAQPQEDTMDNDTVDDDANEDAADDDEDTNDTAAAATQLNVIQN